MSNPNNDAPAIPEVPEKAFDPATARKLLTVEERITRIFWRIQHVQKQNACEHSEAALAVVLREMIELQDRFDDLRDTLSAIAVAEEKIEQLYIPEKELLK